MYFHLLGLDGLFFQEFLTPTGHVPILKLYEDLPPFMFSASPSAAAGRIFLHCVFTFSLTQFTIFFFVFFV